MHRKGGFCWYPQSHFQLLKCHRQIKFVFCRKKLLIKILKEKLFNCLNYCFTKSAVYDLLEHQSLTPSFFKRLPTPLHWISLELYCRYVWPIDRQNSHDLAVISVGVHCYYIYFTYNIYEYTMYLPMYHVHCAIIIRICTYGWTYRFPDNILKHTPQMLYVFHFTYYTGRKQFH